MDLQKEYGPLLRKYFRILNQTSRPPKGFKVPSEIIEQLQEEQEQFRKKCLRENKYGKENDITDLCKVRIEDS